MFARSVHNKYLPYLFTLIGAVHKGFIHEAVFYLRWRYSGEIFFKKTIFYLRWRYSGEIFFKKTMCVNETT